MTRRHLLRAFTLAGCVALASLSVGASLGAVQKSTLADAGSITEVSIRAHMGFLASDALQGRGSGTRDEWLAASYIASQFRRWGLEPLGDAGDFVQAVDLPRSEATAPPILTVGNSRFMHGGEMLVQSVGATHVSGPLVRYTKGAAAPAGSVVLVPDGATPDAVDISAAGVILKAETPQVRGQWAASASRLLTAPRVLPSSIPAAGTTPPASPSPAPTQVVLSTDAYAKFDKLPEGTTVGFNADMIPSHTWNAIGQLKGSDPVRASDVILLTSHLDHLGVRGNGPDRIYNGADDDASGTTAVLEMAEALSKGPRPQRTVMFACFGSEETGGAGARNFLDHPPVPLDHIVANIEFEMIGRPDEKIPAHSLWLTGYERSNLGPELAKQGARIVADPRPDQNFFSRSDNIQLARQGVVAQTVSSFNLHKDYHQPSDELSKIDFAHMTESIQSMLAPVEFLLNGTFKPAWLPGMQPTATTGRGRGAGGR